MCCVSIVKAVTDEAVIVGHVEVCGIAIVFPVGNTIADHKTFEVGSPGTWIGILGIVNPLVDSICELRNIDTSVGFT